MSLKAFHLFFIVVSILLSLFMTGWSFVRYRIDPQNSFVLFGVFSALASLGMLVYLVQFIKKYKRALGVLFVASSLYAQSSYACAVCFNPENESARTSLNMAIGFLLGLTALVLIGVSLIVVKSLKQSEK